MKVAVVGAGPSGLAFTKELHEAGHEVSCFESTNKVGGVFSRPYDGARLTSSNLVTPFSDFRDRRENRATVWNFEQYTEYLNDYVDHFDFRDRILFETRITAIEPVNGDVSQGFDVTSQDAMGEETTTRFDRVAICTGSQQVKVVPDWPGCDVFEGEILHALDFVKSERFAGKRVLVVGGGESGSDISLEVARVAEASGVSLRGKTGHIVWRNLADLEDDGPNRGASDMDTSRAHHSLPHWMGPIIARERMETQKPISAGPDSKANEVVQKIAEINLEQGTSALTKFGLKNASMVRAMVEFGLRRFPDIERVEKDRVVFVDGQEFECDFIICATGYGVDFPALVDSLPEVAEVARKPRENLYKGAVHPDLGAALFWGGYARPAFGAIPPIAEMQARWFALLCSGERELPTPDEMRREIVADNERIGEQFADDAHRIGTLVDFLHYLDDIAEMIGCLPPQKLLLTDRALWRRIMLGPITGAQYRLQGPGAKPEMARESLMRTPMLDGTDGYLKSMVKCKAASLVPVLGRRYKLNATW